MFADAEVEIPAAVVVTFEITGLLKGQPRLGRGRKVGGPAEKPRQTRGDRVQHVSRRVAAGDALRIGGKYRDVRVPSLGEIAPLHPLALIGEVGISAAVA